MRIVSARVLSSFAAVCLPIAGLAGTDNFSTAAGQGGPDGLCDVWQMLYNGWGLVSTADTAGMSSVGTALLRAMTWSFRSEM